MDRRWKKCMGATNETSKATKKETGFLITIVDTMPV